LALPGRAAPRDPGDAVRGLGTTRMGGTKPRSRVRITCDKSHVHPRKTVHVHPRKTVRTSTQR